MKPVTLAIAVISSAAGACGAAVVTSSSGLPGEAEVRQALAKRCDGRAPEIRNVTCEGYEEEPTEFSCTFERREAEGRWTRSSLTMAVDGRHGWIDIGNSDCEDTNTNLSE